MFLFIFLFLLFQPRLHFGSIDFISFFNLLDPDLGDLPLFEYVRIRNTGFISQLFFWKNESSFSIYRLPGSVEETHGILGVLSVVELHKAEAAGGTLELVQTHHNALHLTALRWQNINRLFQNFIGIQIPTVSFIERYRNDWEKNMNKYIAVALQTTKLASEK